MMERVPLARLRHELRTSLNHVVGYAEMLAEELALQDRAGPAPGLRRLAKLARELSRRIDALTSTSGSDPEVVDARALLSVLRTPADGMAAAILALKGEAACGGAMKLLPDLDRIGAAAERLRALIRGEVPPMSPEVGEAGIRAHGPAEPGRAEAVQGTVLIVDDDAQNREMLTRRLRSAGCRVLTAAGGSEALAALGVHPVDVVLLDVMMPGMDGRDVLRRLKDHPDHREIPVLMMSALDELADVVQCIELGAEDYLSKPFEPVFLRARVRACLERKRLRDQEVRHLRELTEWSQTLEQRVREQVAQLERLGRLRRFLSPQLAELIVAGSAEDPLKSHRREITVVFIDLRGFTAFAETAEPEEVMSVLREYHTEMGKLILEHEGTLERFAGDGMMVFFNDPVPMPNPTERAVRMALAMREQLQALGAAWRGKGYDLGAGIGIAEGYATIGAIGFEGRWDYGAIGTVTNLAARLCAAAKGGQVLATARVALILKDLIAVEEAGSYTFKGLHRPVRAVHVLGLTRV